MKEEGMTREERNNKLKHFITCMKCEVSGKCCDENCPIQYDAGNMGEIIENLEEISKILEKECEDAVSRQAVLDIVKFEENWLSDAKSNNADTDIAFSSIRAQVAKLSPVTKALEPCEDAISRKAVLDMATTIQTDDCSGNEVMEVVDVDDIKTLPPVTSARKKGKWIVLKDEYGDICEAICSCCEDNGNHRWKYCPNCGAKMDKE